MVSGLLSPRRKARTMDGIALVNQKDENGLMHGPWKSIYNDGRFWAKGSYVHGKKCGPWVYYADRSYEYGSYVQGERHGLWECFHPNGQLRFRKSYNHGTPHGPWEELFYTGELIDKGCYRYNKQHGPWKV